MRRAVFGGTSIGANISLECASRAPERVVGLVCEGPFLEDSQVEMSLLWSPAFGLFTFGGHALRAIGLAARLLPARDGSLIGLGRDVLTRDPHGSVAFLQGIHFGRVGPPRDERRRVTAPALVIGVHPIDRVHSLSDARRLVEELPAAELVRTASLADLRWRPRRLAERIAIFAGDCWVLVSDPAAGHKGAPA
ncbi:alpha/beta fold hydrolase [Nocardia crassostreae]|uniref:alpha/beta fold hydrolase n=1 Tax=Nocardia crassostreae TaxID=53428 RepID=UPI000A6B1391|nr:hypothetical protein [Nocardia crassostreae]